MGTLTSFPISTKSLSEAPEIAALGTEIIDHAGDNAVHVNSQWKASNESRLANIERALNGITFDFEEQSGTGVTVPFVNPRIVQTRPQILGGKSVAWSQLADDSTLTKGFSNTYDSTTHTYHFNSVTAWQNAIFWNNAINHKYFITFDVKANDGNTPTVKFTTSNIYNIASVVATSSFQTVNAIWNNSGNESRLVIMSQNTASIDVRNIMIIDLTLLYGAGNEPTTVAAFRADYPDAYYAYNAGSLVSADVSAVESVGFNQWDEEWELGSLDDSTGMPVSSSNQIRSKNYCSVLPNTAYHIYVANNYAGGWLHWYDSNHTWISKVYFSNYNYTSPSNACYFKFRLISPYGTTYKNDICINISSSANGTYKPYAHDNISIPSALRTDHPLHSITDGSIYDEYDFERMVFVQRVEVSGQTVTALATPVEVDISSYFVGKPVLSAEGGGSVKFTQTQDPALAVPYELENLIYIVH